MDVCVEFWKETENYYWEVDREEGLRVGTSD